MKLTLPYWIFVTSRKVWGRLGYLVFSCCKSTSARSNSDSVLSISDNGSLMKDQDVRTGDLPLTCSVILSFQENTAASSLLMTSRALCSDFRLSELTISSAEFVSAVKTLYSSSPRLAFPDLIHEKKYNYDQLNKVYSFEKEESASFSFKVTLWNKLQGLFIHPL